MSAMVSALAISVLLLGVGVALRLTWSWLARLFLPASLVGGWSVSFSDRKCSAPLCRLQGARIMCWWPV